MGGPVSITEVGLKNGRIIDYYEDSVEKAPQNIQTMIPPKGVPNWPDELVILVNSKSRYKSENYSFQASEHWTGPTTFQSAAEPFRYEVPENPENIENETLFDHTFYLNPIYRLKTGVNPSDGGSIGLEPSGGTYPYEEEVTLTAKPDEGYEFDRWSRDASGTDNQITVVMDSDKNLTAHFEKPGEKLPLLWLGVGIGIVILLTVAVLYRKYVRSE